MSYRRGSNQFKKKERNNLWMIPAYFAVIIILGIICTLTRYDTVEKVWAEQPIVSAYVSPTPYKAIALSPTPTELENIVTYITKVFEPEGKDVVVRAINCFYSESGLRANAVGQNTDEHQSKDYGVAQLNGYWHNLSDAEKTTIKANIDRAYKIYKGRGGNFSAWYGKGCK